MKPGDKIKYAVDSNCEPELDPNIIYIIKEIRLNGYIKLEGISGLYEPHKFVFYEEDIPLEKHRRKYLGAKASRNINELRCCENPHISANLICKNCHSRIDTINNPF